MVAAISTQAQVGIVLLLLATGTWAFFLAYNWRTRRFKPFSDTERAPNRTTPPTDEELEGRSLTRVLGWSLFFLIISAVGLPLYGTREPGRQEAEAQRFEDESVNRGRQMYQPTASTAEPGGQPPFGCATCHGQDGSGGVTTYSITDDFGRSEPVVWQAPALSTVALRYSTDEIRQILVYGRAGKPMPAWGAAGGGPMSEQQIEDVINYLETPVDGGGLAISSEEALQIAQDDFDAELERVTTEAAATGVAPPSSGEVLFNLNCARCHTKGFSYGQPQRSGGGWFGPSLTDGATVRQFPQISTHITFVAEGAPLGRAYGTGGQSSGAMPHFNQILTAEQIQLIVEYERSL